MISESTHKTLHNLLHFWPSFQRNCGAKVKDSPYLIKRRDSPYYWVKKRIPTALVGHPELLSKKGNPREFLQVSTKTSDRRKANHIAAVQVAQWEKLFNRLMGNEQATSFDDYGGEMEIPENLDFVGEHRRMVEAMLRAQKSFVMKSRNDPSYIAKSEQSDAEWIDEFLEGKPDGEGLWTDEVKEMMARMAITPPISDEELRNHVQQEILSVCGKRASDFVKAKRLANWVVQDYPMTFGEAASRYLAIREESASRKVHVKNQEKAIALFANECLPNGYKTPVENVTGVHVADFAKLVVAKWEARQTRINKLSAVSAVFNYAKRVIKVINVNPFEGYIDHLPKDVERKKKNAVNVAYSREQLVQMFPPLQNFSNTAKSPEAKYVFPSSVLALYTGMRIEEIACLKVVDIQKVNSIDVIEIGKSKTAAGERVIPINKGAKLAIEWLQDFKSQEDDPYLLEGLKVYDNRRSHKLSDRFSTWKRKEMNFGSEKQIYTFHSFRSCVATALDNADLPIDYQSLILGHEDGRSTLAQTVYSSGKRLEKLKDAADKIDYGPKVYKLCKELLSDLS